MLSAAVLAGWSGAEWRVRTSELCDAFTVRVQEAIDRLEREGERKRGEREMKGEPPAPAHGDGVGEDEDEDGCDEVVLGEGDEVELRLLLSSFIGPVVSYLHERQLLRIGMDERVLMGLGALNSLCQHVLSHAQLLSVEGQIGLLSLFPDLAAWSDEQVGLWMAHQQQKLRTLLQRIIAQHRQHTTAVVQDASSPFAASVLDVFTVLSATASGYFDHLRRLAPFGLSTFTAFLSSLDGSVVDYCDAVVAAMGDPRSLIPYGDEECKLKQSEEWAAEHPSLLMKQAKRLQAVADRHPNLRLAAVEQANKSNARKAMDELSQRSVVDRSDPDSAASHSMAELCVHVASVQAAVDMLADLQQQIKQAWTQLELAKPQVKQKAEAMAQQEEVAGADAAKLERQLHSGAVVGLPPSSSSASFATPAPSAAAASSAAALLRLSAGTTSHLFPSATARLYEQKKRACELLSTAVVFCEWREPLLVDLYNPSVAAGSRVVGGFLLDVVNTTMPIIYKALQPAVFPVLCQHLLGHLCLGLSYVLVYGRRVVERSDVHQFLLPDILAVELLFASELSALTVEGCCHDYRRLLSVCAWSTEKMLAQYADYDPKRVPIPRMSLARLIGLRRGSLVGHFMKTERGKQKQRQQQTQTHSSTPSVSAPSTSRFALRAFSSASRPSPSPLLSSSSSSAHSGGGAAMGNEQHNPFAEHPDAAQHHREDVEWELVDNVTLALPTSLPVSASFPPPHRPSSSTATSGSIPITDLLARNAVRSSPPSSSSSNSSSSTTSSSASLSLQKTQRVLSHGLSNGLSKGKLLYSKLKAKAV